VRLFPPTLKKKKRNFFLRAAALGSARDVVVFESGDDESETHLTTASVRYRRRVFALFFVFLLRWRAFFVGARLPTTATTKKEKAVLFLLLFGKKMSFLRRRER
jgi:hypothetical protein